jgi:ABC-type sugar transport system ATPase subunit
MMLGRRMADMYPAKVYGSGPVVLHVSALQAERVNGVSFDAHGGEILGIAGLVGAGKTELLQTIFGENKRHGGSVEVDGKAVAANSPRRAIASGIALIPESRKEQGLVLLMDIVKNTSLASINQDGSQIIRLSTERTRVKGAVEAVELKASSLDERVVNLSGGNQQKVVLAKWLMRGSRVLLFDEPTRGVDVGAKFQIYQLIIEIAKAGATVVISSSEVEEIAAMCHRVLVLRGGRCISELTAAEVTTENILTQMASGHD